MRGSASKSVGRVYTPEYLVCNILDMCGYVAGADILNKHIVEPSCGDGSFLVEVVRRFICTSRSLGMSDEAVRDALSTYIHGIELDKNEVDKCIVNLTSVASSYGIQGVTWDVECADSLKHTRYIGNSDFVVGNPPYVRVHSLDLDTKFLKNNYTFARNGMTDLYIAFYELGLYMLNDTGILGYVTPSSFFNSKAGAVMRDYLTHARCLKAIVDFGHTQVFEATTYATIAILTRSENTEVDYYLYDVDSQQPYAKRSLEYGDFLADDGTFLFAKDALVYKVLASDGVRKLCVVKNGITSLLDEFFMSADFEFTDYTIPIIKASTSSQERCIFPYDNLGRVLPYDVLESITWLNKRYTDYKERLLSRDLAGATVWYEFGRAQGIKDVFVQKYAMNFLIRDMRDIKLVSCPAGTGVYGGLYILTDISEEKLRSILNTPEFVTYVKSLGKFKSGGYYTFSSKELQLYLNYVLSDGDSISI